jgi:hypothetical protein
VPTVRRQLRDFGNTLLGFMPLSLRRMLLKGFADRPELAESAGHLVLPRRFDTPGPIVEEISRELLKRPRVLPGIDLRTDSALALLASLVEKFAGEIAQIPRERTPECILWMENHTYQDFDTATLYAMLRHLKPKRYVEVGCGFSSRTSTLALRRNATEGATCDAHYIDAWPAEHLREIELPGPLHGQRVQDVPLELFTALEAGDVLFIDTSHVLKTQSDVEWELLHIVPALKPGVWIHFHDIFTPYDYPEEWVIGVPRGGLNEQYGVECLLSGGARFQVELPVHYLWKDHRAALDRLCANTTDRPAAFWFRRIG